MLVNKNKIDMLSKKLYSIFQEDKKNRICKSNRYVFFETNRDGLISLVFTKFIVAKSIQKKYNCEPICIRTRYDYGIDCLAKGFSIKTFFFDKRINICVYIKSLFVLLKCLLFYNNPNKFLKLKCKDVLIGDLIYDTIIRENKNVYTIDRMITVKNCKYILKAAVFSLQCDEMYQKYPPRYFVAGEMLYLQAIFARFAVKYGAVCLTEITGKELSIYQCDDESDKLLIYHDLTYKKVEEYMHEQIDEQEIDKVLSDLVNGVGDWNVHNAYKNKIIINKERLKQILGINNEKMNVVIMAHCFSDAPHCAYIIYKDYYEWLIETLKIASENKNVNWILKPHPSRSVYGEEGVVEDIYEKYKSDNIYWLDDKYSTRSLMGFADAIVTVTGSAGYELSCFGVPCINAGKAFYSGFGYTINAENIEEYKKILMNLSLTIHSLEEDKVRIAKKVFWATKQQEPQKIKGILIADILLEYYNMYVVTRDEKNNNDSICDRFQLVMDSKIINEIIDYYAERV